jgi:hypothetical protein
MQTANYQIKLGAKHGRWLYWGNKKKNSTFGVFCMVGKWSIEHRNRQGLKAGEKHFRR